MISAAMLGTGDGGGGDVPQLEWLTRQNTESYRANIPFFDPFEFVAGDYFSFDLQFLTPAVNGFTSLFAGNDEDVREAGVFLYVSGGLVDELRVFSDNGSTQVIFDFSGEVDFNDLKRHTVKLEKDGSNYVMTIDDTYSRSANAGSSQTRSITTFGGRSDNFRSVTGVISNIEVFWQAVGGNHTDIPVNEGTGVTLNNYGSAANGAIIGATEGVNYQWL